MKKELNIAEILKDKPNGTKLYADAFGELSLERTKDNEDDGIYTKSRTFNSLSFYSNGKYTKYGEPILVPSKKMTDWNKFAWKKGDVLVSNDGETNVIFNKWEDDTYTSFYGRHYLNTENEDKDVYYKIFVCTTEMYSIANKDIAKDYISSIEKKFGGKLNLKTLEIDKSQLEFKDGDIVANPCILYEGVYIFIYNALENLNKLGFYVALDNVSDDLYFPKNNNYWCTKNKNIRYATEEEKQRLFKALNAAGKRWNAEKKVVEDVKKPTPKRDSPMHKKESDKLEHKFQPFEKVLVRDVGIGKWIADLYGIKNEGDPYPYRCVGGSYAFCIPYEGNEQLLGTTKDVEEDYE